MGTLFAVIACLLMTAKDTVSKKVSFNVDGLVSSVASFAYALPYYLLTLPILYLFGFEDFLFTADFWVFVLLRAFTDSMAETFKMYAFASGSLTTVSAFLALTPIMTLLLSPYITGDSMSGQIFLGVLLSVAGGYLIIYQKAEKVNLKCMGFALLSTLFFGLNVCLDRLCAQSASAVFSGFVMTFLAGLIVAPLVLLNRLRREQFFFHRKAFYLRGFYETAFMIFKLLALQLISAPQWAALSRLSLLFSVFSGGFYFNEKNIIRKIIGAIITIAGVFLALN